MRVFFEEQTFDEVSNRIPPTSHEGIGLCLNDARGMSAADLHVNVCMAADRLQVGASES